MTFVLYPLSHYNSITKPRAWFFLSLLEHLTIDFSFHFILSIIDVHKDLATRDKLIFPSAITRILRHFSVPFPLSDHIHVMGAIDATTVKQSEANFIRGGPGQQLLPLLQLYPPPLPLLLWEVWPLMWSWPSFSAWMPTLMHSLLWCIKWTLVLAVLPDDWLALVALWSLPLLLLRHLRMMTTPMSMMMMRMEILAFPVLMRCLLDTLTFCHSWQKGRVVLDIRVVILRRRVSIGDFC